MRLFTGKRPPFPLPNETVPLGTPEKLVLPRPKNIGASRGNVSAKS